MRVFPLASTRGFNNLKQNKKQTRKQKKTPLFALLFLFFIIVNSKGVPTNTGGKKQKTLAEKAKIPISLLWNLFGGVSQATN